MSRRANTLDDIEASRATNDGYSRLMAGILLQAAIDAKAKDSALKLEALLWLASPEAEEFCDVLQVPDVFAAIMEGKQAPTLRRGWRINSNRNWRVLNDRPS